MVVEQDSLMLLELQVKCVVVFIIFLVVEERAQELVPKVLFPLEA